MARSKSAKPSCPQCGASNDPTAKRCRMCAEIINADGVDVGGLRKGIPDHVQRQIDETMAERDRPLPPPPAAAAGAFGGGVLVDAGVAIPGPEPASDFVDDGPAFPASDAPFDADALYRDQQLSHLPPPPAAPPPKDAPRPELTMPPPPPRFDALGEVGRGQEGQLSAEEIKRLTDEAVRQERMNRRPKLLGKVFRDGDDADDLKPF